MTTTWMGIGLIVGFAFLSVPLFVFVSHRRTKRESPDQESFESRFPPISDEEFLARCGPGTDPEIALGVRRIVSEKLGIEYERIHPAARFMDDLGAD